MGEYVTHSVREVAYRVNFQNLPQIVRRNENIIHNCKTKDNIFSILCSSQNPPVMFEDQETIRASYPGPENQLGCFLCT